MKFDKSDGHSVWKEMSFEKREQKLQSLFIYFNFKSRQSLCRIHPCPAPARSRTDEDCSPPWRRLSSPLPSSASSLSLCLQIQSIVATAIIIATWHQASAECDPCRLKSGLGVGRHAPHLHLYAAQGRRGWSMPTIIIFIIISIGITTIVGVFPRIHPPPSPPHPLQRWQNSPGPVRAHRFSSSPSPAHSRVAEVARTRDHWSPLAQEPLR